MNLCLNHFNPYKTYSTDADAQQLPAIYLSIIFFPASCLLSGRIEVFINDALHLLQIQIIVIFAFIFSREELTLHNFVKNLMTEQKILNLVSLYRPGLPSR